MGFVNVGDRIRYIADHKGRNEAWPDGVWLQTGNEGAVKEYHPESPAVLIRGELFEAIPEWAHVVFDNGSETCIDPDYEGKRWERIK